MPFASFANVFPVQGAIIIRSIFLTGPKGSASTIVTIGSRFVISIIFSQKALAVVNLVSIEATALENTGYKSAPSAFNLIIWGSTSSNVQKEPVIQNPIFLPSSSKTITPYYVILIVSSNYFLNDLVN